MILKPKPLIVAGVIVLALALGALFGFLVIKPANKPITPEQVFTARLESVGIVVEPHAPEMAKAFCTGNVAGNAAVAAALVFSDESDPNRELKAKTYIDSVVELCKHR